MKIRHQSEKYELNEIKQTMSKKFKKFNFNASLGTSAGADADAGEAEQPPEKVQKQVTSPSAAQQVRSPSYKFKKFNFDATKGLYSFHIPK